MLASCDDNAGRKILGVVQALHRRGGLALKNEVISHRLHSQDSDFLPQQNGKHLDLETVEVMIHDVQWQLHSVECELMS